MNLERFATAVFKRGDELPDHYLQEINNLVDKLLRESTIDDDNKTLRDANIGLAALQRTLGILVARFYRKDNREAILADMCRAISMSVQEFTANEK